MQHSQFYVFRIVKWVKMYHMICYVSMADPNSGYKRNPPKNFLLENLDENVAVLQFICAFGGMPSSIYSWSIIYILEHEFFCLGHLGSTCSKEIKVD